uniref:PiggyBac transposable element-derived protein domain-containing protein n=1 Tax=Panagrolaimus sp. PS1159 TaxID=55785 RepID=A0AC35EXG5_9BILA
MDFDDDFNEDYIPEKKPKLEILSQEPQTYTQTDVIELFNNASDDEVVFKWTEKEIKEMLIDFVRFTVFKAAFPDLEVNSGPHEKLFKSYKLLNTEINSMCNFMLTYLGLPEEFNTAIRRHSQRIACYRYVNHPCMVCQTAPSHNIKYLGPNYHKTDLKIEKSSFPPQSLLLCNLHTYFADTFFSLVHMKWNIHLNIKHRIKQRSIPYRGNKSIDEDIGNDVINNLAVYYFHIFCRLRSSDATLMNLRSSGSLIVFREALRSIENKTRNQKVSKKFNK